jgi:predicted DNA-binding transcriptional regulator AlpA
MAEPDSQRQNNGDKLFTLSEISHKTGISMPTLQRYKKTYQDRIPSVGQGRKQRYPENALPVFDEIKNENAGKRGRPRKDASAPRAAAPAAKRRPGRPAKSSGAAAKRGRKPAVSKRAATAPTGRRPGRPRKNAPPAGGGGGRAQKASGNLLTLTQISETTGISYPTLVRYVRLHSDRLPHEGRGRGRRFYPQAVDVFRQLRSESGRGGRKKGSGAGRPAAAKTGRGRGGRGRGRAAAASSSSDTGAFAQRLKAIEKTQQNLEKRLKGLLKSLQSFFR